VLDLSGGIRTRIDAVLQSAMWVGICAAAIGTAVLFLLIALFIALYERYDALTACLTLGALFVVAAAIAALAFTLASRPPRRVRPAPDPRALLVAGSEEASAALQDAGIAVSEGIKRAVRRRPLAALGLMLCAGFVFGVTRR
jgi:hypothetical protein